MGIILKTPSSEGQTFVTLSQTLGKINLVALKPNQKKQLRSGSVINFNARTLTGTLHASDDINLHTGLQTKSASELYWLHLLFEICYYFVPLHQPVDIIFTFLHNCTLLLDHRNLFDVQWPLIQKSTVGCLFLLLGFAPPLHITHLLTTTKTTILLFIDFTNDQKVELCKQYVQVLNKIPLAALDKWVLQCIQTHPSRQLFKTINFVYPPQHK